MQELDAMSIIIRHTGKGAQLFIGDNDNGMIYPLSDRQCLLMYRTLHSFLINTLDTYMKDKTP